MSAESGSEWTLPAGAPFRVAHWLIPPFALLMLAGIEIAAAVGAGSLQPPAWSITAALASVAAAVAVWIAGYLAHHDLTQEAVDRYAVTKAIALLVAGLVLSTGVFGIVPLAWAGHRTADLRRRRSGRAPAVASARLWRRTAVIAAVVGLVCALLTPLALGLASAPLIGAVTIGRIILPFVFGFAFRLGRD